MSRADWVDLGRKRILSVLRTRGVANMSTLESKISNAGPGRMRVEPHILTEARRELESLGLVEVKTRKSTPWYSLSDLDAEHREQRLAELAAVHDQLTSRHLTDRIGQALEIAIFRVLADSGLRFLGHFPDLNKHDDSQHYTKIEPPTQYGALVLPSDARLDFIVPYPAADIGIEVKNLREWIYPKEDFWQLIWKCCHLDLVPTLIARRINYRARTLLIAAGGLVLETLNQRIPEADRAIAERAADKDLLGYHDIRIGNEPDDRMLAFLNTNVPTVLPRQRTKFEHYRSSILQLAEQATTGNQSARRAATRSLGRLVDVDVDDIA